MVKKQTADVNCDARVSSLTKYAPMLCNLPNVVRVVAINFSGNTGKTTLCRHLLLPALPGAELIRVESINNSGASTADLEVGGKDFEEVARALFAADRHTIVDIGASNVELARSVLHRLGDAHEEVELWVVPCVPAPAAQAKIYRDSIATLKELVLLGVNPACIAVIKNKVLDVDSMDADFAEFVGAARAMNCIVIDRPVLEFDVYSDLDQRPGSLDEIAADSTNYRAVMKAARAAGKGEEAAYAMDAEFRRKNARTALSNLEQVRNDLFRVLTTVAA